MGDEVVPDHLPLHGAQLRRTGADEADIRTPRGEQVCKQCAVRRAVKEENRRSGCKRQDLFDFVRGPVVHQLDGQQIPAVGEGVPDLIQLAVTVVFRVKFPEGKAGVLQKGPELLTEGENFGIRHGVPEDGELRIIDDGQSGGSLLPGQSAGRIGAGSGTGGRNGEVRGIGRGSGDP